jgi:hypothetical protein
MTTARRSWLSIDAALRLKVCSKKARSQTPARTYACTGPEVLPDMREAHREQVEKLARQQRDASRDRNESREVAVA